MKNLTFSQKAGTTLTAFVLAGTLAGCGEPTKETTVENTPPVSQNDNADQTPEAIKIIEEQKETASNEVEAAIGIMVEETALLGGYAKDATQTEAFQESKEKAVDNFETIADFTFNGGEIAGYTAKDVREGTVEFAKDSVYKIDAGIEHFVPEYKDRAKARLQQFGAWSEEKLNQGIAWLESDEAIDMMAKAYNKYEELKDKASNIKDKVLSKSKEE